MGRPHIAAALVRRRHVPSMEAAFDLYLARGRPAYRHRPRLTAADAVALTRRSGGAAVLAHPHTVAAGAAEYAAALEAFAALGGAGVECHYPDYPPDLQAHLAAVDPPPGHGPHRRLRLPRGAPPRHRPRHGAAATSDVPDESLEELRRRLAFLTPGLRRESAFPALQSVPALPIRPLE